MSFGTYPEVCLTQARKRRDDARKLLADVIDPAWSSALTSGQRGLLPTTPFASWLNCGSRKPRRPKGDQPTEATELAGDGHLAEHWQFADHDHRPA